MALACNGVGTAGLLPCSLSVGVQQRNPSTGLQPKQRVAQHVYWPVVQQGSVACWASPTQMPRVPVAMALGPESHCLLLLWEGRSAKLWVKFVQSVSMLWLIVTAGLERDQAVNIEVC